MQTAIILKDFSALSPEAVQVKHAIAPTRTESPSRPSVKSGDLGEDLRETQQLRYTAPLASPDPYRHWGISD